MYKMMRFKMWPWSLKIINVILYESGSGRINNNVKIIMMTMVVVVGNKSDQRWIRLIHSPGLGTCLVCG